MYAHKRYTIWLVFLAAAGMLILVSTSFYLQPLAGDMTRVGGYAENDFGWNRPQKIFEKETLLVRTNYDQYADVLVLGDSFSFGGINAKVNFPWQTFLAANTGLSVTTINHYTKFDPPPPEYGPDLLFKIVNSETFKKTPPRVFILEVIERQLNMLPVYAGNCRLEHKIERKPDFNLNPNPPPLIDAYRKTSLPPLKQQIAYARKYLYGLLQRQWDKNPAVYQTELTTSQLFSNKLSGRLLGYKDDFKIISWDEPYLANIRCNLINAQNLVQKNGKTLFVAMVVPDKLSAYSRYLKDQSYADTSIIDRLASSPSLHLVRIDKALKDTIDEGVVDVYLPNDSHWGYRGHQTAATALAQHLANFTGD